MARRNRKKKKNGFALPVPFAGIVVLICTVGLSYTWLNCRCEGLGKEIKGLEQQLVELETRYEREEYRWMRLKSPRSIRQALDRNRLVMTWPRPDQVVHLSDNGIGVLRHELALHDRKPIDSSGLRRYVMNE